MFSGNSWVAVGDTDFSADRADYINIKISSGGVPVVAYNDKNNLYKASVKYFNGASWVDLGTPDFSSGEADWVALAIGKSGVPYVGFVDFANSHTASVYSFGVPASIKEVNDIASVSVYPNPNNGNFSIRVQTKTTTDISLALFDIVGQQVWSAASIEVNGNYSSNINAENLSKGTYFLKMKTNEGISTQKIEIVR